MSVQQFFIQRADPTDPCSALEFFPPKGSDELHIALMQSYPHLKNLQSRMRQAVIEFHLGEQQQDDFDAINTPVVSDQTTPEYLPSPISSFASTMGTPLTCQKQFTPSTSGPSQDVPSQEQLMTVWSLPSTQAKVHKRRNMTDAEKIAYKAKRIEGACADCKRRRRRCDHNSSSTSTSPTSLPTKRRQSKQEKRTSTARSAASSSQPRINHETTSLHKATSPPIPAPQTLAPQFNDFFDMTIDPALTFSQSPLDFNDTDLNYSAGFDFSADFELFPDLPQTLDPNQNWNHQNWQNSEANGSFQPAGHQSLEWYPQSPHQNRFLTEEVRYPDFDTSESSPSSSISPQPLQPLTDQNFVWEQQNSGRQYVGNTYLDTSGEYHAASSDLTASASPAPNHSRSGVIEHVEWVKPGEPSEQPGISTSPQFRLSEAVKPPASDLRSRSPRLSPNTTSHVRSRSSRSSAHAATSHAPATRRPSVDYPATLASQQGSNESRQHVTNRTRSSHNPSLEVSIAKRSSTVKQTTPPTRSLSVDTSSHSVVISYPYSSTSLTRRRSNRKTDRMDIHSEMSVPQAIAATQPYHTPSTRPRIGSHLSESFDTDRRLSPDKNQQRSSGHLAAAADVISRLRIVSRLCSMFPSSVSELSEFTRLGNFIGLGKASERNTLSYSVIAAMALLWAMFYAAMSCTMLGTGSLVGILTCAAQVGLMWSLSALDCSMRSNPSKQVTYMHRNGFGIAA